MRQLFDNFRLVAQANEQFAIDNLPLLWILADGLAGNHTHGSEPTVVGRVRFRVGSKTVAILAAGKMPLRFVPVVNKF